MHVFIQGMENAVSKNAVALRAFRQRQQKGLALLLVEVETNAFAAALIRRGIVEADRPVGRAELANLAAGVLRLWANQPQEDAS